MKNLLKTALTAFGVTAMLVSAAAMSEGEDFEFRKIGIEEMAELDPVTVRLNIYENEQATEPLFEAYFTGLAGGPAIDFHNEQHVTYSREYPAPTSEKEEQERVVIDHYQLGTNLTFEINPVDASGVRFRYKHCDLVSIDTRAVNDRVVVAPIIKCDRASSGLEFGQRHKVGDRVLSFTKDPMAPRPPALSSSDR